MNVGISGDGIHVPPEGLNMSAPDTGLSAMVENDRHVGHEL